MKFTQLSDVSNKLMISTRLDLDDVLTSRRVSFKLKRKSLEHFKNNTFG